MAAMTTATTTAKASARPPKRHMRRSTARWAILILVGGWLLLPLLAMLEFATRGPDGSRSLDNFVAIGDNDNLVAAIITSLEIAVLTVVGMLVLLIPTMTWTYLRVPRMKRVVEFLCLLPLAIPAIVLVVGIAPIYSILNGIVGGSPLTLVFIDIILVLPYAHRAIDAGLKSIDVNTLAEAARSLGAGWPRVMVQIIVPNIRAAIVSASVITVALVLGEFTISSLLSFDTLQVVINLLGKRDAFISVAVSFAALIFAFILIWGLASVGPRRRRTPDDTLEEEVAR
jgi:putative spermidine/putrescine transport system permease protein